MSHDTKTCYYLIPNFTNLKKKLYDCIEDKDNTLLPFRYKFLSTSNVPNCSKTIFDQQTGNH